MTYKTIVMSQDSYSMLSDAMRLWVEAFLADPFSFDTTGWGDIEVAEQYEKLDTALKEMGLSGFQEMVGELSLGTPEQRLRIQQVVDGTYDAYNDPVYAIESLVGNQAFDVLDSVLKETNANTTI